MTPTTSENEELPHRTTVAGSVERACRTVAALVSGLPSGQAAELQPLVLEALDELVRQLGFLATLDDHASSVEARSWDQLLFLMDEVQELAEELLEALADGEPLASGQLRMQLELLCSLTSGLLK